MRTVSFVDHFEFPFSGSLSSKAIALGDIDNDGDNELAIANKEAQLNIYKKTQCLPWKICNDLGMVTCLKIGDISNNGLNHLICSSCEGWIHVFCLGGSASSTNLSDLNSSLSDTTIRPKHRQHLAANSKDLLLADIDGDGFVELIIAYSDRKVHSYRWMDIQSTKSPSSTVLDTNSEKLTSEKEGKFVHIETWKLAGQIGSMTLNKRDGKQGDDVLVSQPGGSFVTLISASAKQNDTVAEPSGSMIEFHPLGSSRARNHGVTSEIVGNISRCKKGEEKNLPNYCAVCTLDGTLTLIDYDKILWSMYVDHRLFNLSKLDITGDGTEEVVVCSWDGETYILNLNKDILRFGFNQNVSSFCAGHYAFSDGQNEPCLVYVTLDNKIVIYRNINISQVASNNLFSVMNKNESYKEILKSLNIDDTDTETLRKLYQQCLYGYTDMLDNG